MRFTSLLLAALSLTMAAADTFKFSFKNREGGISQCAVPMARGNSRDDCAFLKNSFRDDKLVDHSSFQCLESDEWREQVEEPGPGYPTRWVNSDGSDILSGGLVMPMKDGGIVEIKFAGEWPTAEEVEAAVKAAGYDEEDLKETQKSIDIMIERVNRLERR